MAGVIVIWRPSRWVPSTVAARCSRQPVISPQVTAEMRSQPNPAANHAARSGDELRSPRLTGHGVDARLVCNLSCNRPLSTLVDPASGVEDAVSRSSSEGIDPHTLGRHVALFEAYRTGFRDMVQTTIRRADEQDGRAILGPLVDFYTGWLRRPDWRGLWAFMTAAGTGAVDEPDQVEAVVGYLREERRLLERLAEAAGAAHPAALASCVHIMVYGSGIAAALDGGEDAVAALRNLLAAVWQEQASHQMG